MMLERGGMTNIDWTAQVFRPSGEQYEQMSPQFGEYVRQKRDLLRLRSVRRSACQPGRRDFSSTKRGNQFGVTGKRHKTTHSRSRRQENRWRALSCSSMHCASPLAFRIHFGRMHSRGSLPPEMRSDPAGRRKANGRRCKELWWMRGPGWPDPQWQCSPSLSTGRPIERSPPTWPSIAREEFRHGRGRLGATGDQD